MGARTYQPGEKIIAEGTFGTETFFIENGTVSILKETGQSNPVVLATLADGDVFGEMYLFGPAGFRSASAVATTPVTVHVADRVEMETALADTPHRIKTLLHTINRRLEKTSQEFSITKMQLRRQLLTARFLIALLVLSNVFCLILWLMSRSV